MPLHHAVLALLAEGPSHGYQLKASFEESVGPQWGSLNIGHLYQILDRLVREDLVGKRHVPQADRPDKIVYQLTPAGREELDRWLGTPFVREGGYRDDFFLKLLAASKLGSSELDEVLRVQREAYVNELAALGELRAQHVGDALVQLLIEAAILHTEANLRVVEAAESQRARLARSEAARRTEESSMRTSEVAG